MCVVISSLFHYFMFMLCIMSKKTTYVVFVVSFVIMFVTLCACCMSSCYIVFDFNMTYMFGFLFCSLSCLFAASRRSCPQTAAASTT